jgi:hypothetical protein
MLMIKNLLVQGKNNVFMIIEGRANADFLNAKPDGDLCRIKICGVGGGIIDEG